MNINDLNKQMSTQAISKIIKTRRSVYPPMYTDEAITKNEVLTILENGNWAPTHRKTEPWRYKVIMEERLNRFNQFISDNEEELIATGKATAMKLKKLKQKVERSSCILAICMYRDPEVTLPEWEEIAAVACSVQNMWLTCTTMNIGSYWSSPKSFFDPFLELEEGERCLGFFYMGKKMDIDLESERTPIESKIKWL